MDDKQRELFNAAGKGDIQALEKLALKGFEMNIRSDCSDYSIAKIYRGITPLIAAIDSEREACVDYLVKQGVDVNFADSNGNSPLLMASYAHNLFITNLLIQQGADVNAKAPDNKDAYTFAFDGYVDHVDLDSTEEKKEKQVRLSHFIRLLINSGYSLSNDDGKWCSSLLVTCRAFVSDPEEIKDLNPYLHDFLVSHQEKKALVKHITASSSIHEMPICF